LPFSKKDVEEASIPVLPGLTKIVLSFPDYYDVVGATEVL
jgi:hypothetical protein